MTSVQKKSIKFAADCARQAHYGQFRKDGTTSFIVHPERVAKQVKFFGGNHIGIIAAWLHDVMEDCNDGDRIVRNTLKHIDLPQQERDEILTIVYALTKNSSIKGKSDRLADTLKRINQAPSQAILIKLCDRMDNLNDARDQGGKFLSVYLRCTDQLIEALSDSAMMYGYFRALETLKALRRTYPR